jgi:mono/diheme cytochrome c family protein
MAATLAGWSGIAVTAGHSLARAAGAEELFVKHCASCHGHDGKARTPAARKSGAKDLSVSKTTDAEIEKQIVEGKKDQQGLQKMPPFKGRLTPEEIQSLIGWVKRFRT